MIIETRVVNNLKLDRKYEGLLRGELMKINSVEELDEFLETISNHIPKEDMDIQEIKETVLNNYDKLPVNYISLNKVNYGDTMLLIGFVLGEIEDNRYFYSYVYNVNVPYFSEFGTISVEEENNVLRRVF